MTVTVDLLALGGICGAILSVVAVIGLIARPLKKIQKQYIAMSHGLLVILHFRLIREGMKLDPKPCITPSERDDFDDIYKAYTALGGNGSGTVIYERIMSKPICDAVHCEHSLKEREKSNEHN